MNNKILYLFFFLTLTKTIYAQEMVDGEIVSTNTISTKKATNDYINFYQKHLSAIKSAQCAMYPSCSNYGKIVIENNNFFKAIPLIADRMIRCSQDKKNYDTTYKYGKASLVDCPDEEYSRRLFETKKPRTDISKYSKDSTLTFIKFLINENDYQSALLEIRRAKFYKSTDNFVELEKLKLICLQGIGDYEKGIYEYETIKPDSLKKRGEIALEGAKMYYLIGNFERSINTLEENRYSKEKKITHDINILKAAANAQLLNIKESKNAIDNATAFSDNSYQNNFNQDFIHKLENIKFKNPTKAKILSIIPGAGYLYAGHKGSAATAFLINGLLAYATYTSLKNDNYGIATLTSFFSLSFYIGNIMGAGKSAKRYNKNKKDKLIKEFEHINNIFNQ